VRFRVIATEQGPSTKKFSGRRCGKPIDAHCPARSGQIEHGLQHLRFMPVEFLADRAESWRKVVLARAQMPLPGAAAMKAESHCLAGAIVAWVMPDIPVLIWGGNGWRRSPQTMGCSWEV